MPVNCMPGGSWPPSGVLAQDRATVLDPQPQTPVVFQQNTFGDKINKKRPQVFRGVSCQLGNLPTHPQDPKHQALIKAISHYQADVTAIQEIGINFSYAGVEGQWKKRIGWNHWIDGNHTKTVTAWNTNSRTKATRQWGGTAIIASGDTTTYAAGSGIDPSNLGRWCWTRYRGTEGCFFCVYSFYRPTNNKTGQLSVYAQHRTYLNEHDVGC